MKIKLDLGCGMRKRENDFESWWYGVDIRNFDGVDFVLDLGSEKLPFENDFVDEIQAIHLFEHFYPEQLFFCINECWRVLKPKGRLHIEVPKAGTLAYFIHPDHKIQFVEDTFGFWQVPAFGKDPHGYIDKYWHVEILPTDHLEHIKVDMYPNKPNGRYDFVKIS